MKLVTFSDPNGRRIGALLGEQVVDLHATNPELPQDMLPLLQGGDAMLEKAQAAITGKAVTLALADVKLECPIPAAAADFRHRPELHGSFS